MMTPVPYHQPTPLTLTHLTTCLPLDFQFLIGILYKQPLFHPMQLQSRHTIIHIPQSIPLKSPLK
jgi:hypothetical protein